MGWRSSDVVRATAIVILMYAAVRLLWFAQSLVFTVFMGVLFGLAVSSGVDRLQRWRIPRGVGAALLVLGAVGILGGVGAWIAPTLRTQSQQLRTRLPEAAEKIQQWVERHRGGVLGAFLDAGDATAGATRQAGGTVANAVTGRQAPAAAESSAVAPGAQPGSPTGTQAAAAPDTHGATHPGTVSLKERLVHQAAGARRFFFGFVTSTLAAVAGLVLVLVLSIYIAADPGLYHRGLMHLMPFEKRERAGDVMSAMAVALRKWLVTQLIAMAVIGGVTTLTLLALGIEAALPLGIIAGLLEFVPTVGPIMSAVPAIAMGFVDSPEKALWVALAYFGIQQLENHLLIPFLMKSGVDLPPALTIIAQALMALVFGFLGLLVAVPLLAAVMVAVKMLYVEGVVGEQVEVLDAGDG